MTEHPDETGTGRPVAVVTGGAGAIGGAIVAELSAGHTVVSLDQAADPPVDLGCADQVRAAAAQVLRQHRRGDASDTAAALTGQTLCVDGGFVLR